MRGLFCNSPGTYDYLRCTDCWFTWISPQPTAKELNLLYEQYYDETLDSPDVITLSASRKNWIRELVLNAYKGYPLKKANLPAGLDKIIGLFLGLIPPILNRSTYGLGLTFPAYVRNGRLLEIGCGHGWLLKLMKEWGWEVLGVEWNPVSARIGKEKFGVDILDGDLTSQNLHEGYYDVIVMRHVLEHVYDPVQLLTDCSRLLKPKGALLIAMPNVKSLGSQWFGRYWRGLTPPWHLHLFTPRALEILLRKLGYVDIKIRTRSFPAHWIYTTSKMVREGNFSLHSNQKVRSCWWFHILEVVLNMIYGDFGEELEAIAYRS